MIVRLALLCILFVIIILFLKEQKSEIAVVVSVCASVILLFFVCQYIAEAIYSLLGIVEKTGVDKEIVVLLFRIVGTGYVCEFASNVCEDFGSKSLGDKISLGGKACILVLTLPILNRLVDLIFSVM